MRGVHGATSFPLLRVKGGDEDPTFLGNTSLRMYLGLSMTTASLLVPARGTGTSVCPMELGMPTKVG